VADEDEIPWARDEPLFVVVRLSCRSLDVYRNGRRIRTYDTVAGMGGSSKQFEGDRRTPLGLYSVVEKYPHPRWRHFLLLDYPNGSDLVRYEEALSTGDVPESENGEPIGLGNAIGIHGTDKPDDNRKGIDWTFGCISVDNRAIEDLVRLLPRGTPVLIQR
jgi:murein L,D-transpeptidase YafK